MIECCEGKKDQRECVIEAKRLSMLWKKDREPENKTKSRENKNKEREGVI